MGCSRSIKFTMKIESIEKEIQYILNLGKPRLNSPEYWATVGKGITLLFKIKPLFSNKEDLKDYFIETKGKILKVNPDPFNEEILDEMEAIIIKAYPMPDFWEATLDDFKKHNNFQDVFE